MGRILNHLRESMSGRTIVDETFGLLRFHRVGRNADGLWSGTVDFPPAGRRFPVLIRAGADGPTGHQRKLWGQIVERFAEIQRPVQQALFTTYQSSWLCQPHASHVRPLITSPDELPQVVSLDRIWIESPDADRFTLSYAIRDEEEHELNVFVNDWRDISTGLEG